MQKKVVSASLLGANFSCLGQECQNALSAGVDMMHFDVMDHHFVPNLGLSVDACKALRPLVPASVIFDVHLMVTNPEPLFEPFAKAGANWLLFHPETVPDLSAAIDKIITLGCLPGFVFNPNKQIYFPLSFL